MRRRAPCSENTKEISGLHTFVQQLCKVGVVVPVIWENVYTIERVPFFDQPGWTTPNVSAVSAAVVHVGRVFLNAAGGRGTLDLFSSKRPLFSRRNRAIKSAGRRRVIIGRFTVFAGAKVPGAAVFTGEGPPPPYFRGVE